MATDARARSPQDGVRRRRDFNRSPYVTLGAVRYTVRRAPPPRACPCRCCSEEAVAACLGRSKPDRRTLERFQRRLGRATRDERPSRQQRLKDFTERLLPRAHAAPTPPPPPPPPPPPHTAPILPPVPPPRSRHRHSPPRGVSVDRCDDFDADKITLIRVEPRSIIGSYAQKTIPYRSASFSQGDFVQDKYYRGKQPSIFDFGKRVPNTSDSALRRDCSASVTEENATEGGSVASVDSAVGSDEGLLAHALPVARSPPPDALHKQLGARSLTHPLPRRVPPVREEDSTDAGGSLPALMPPRVLHELREESDGSQADSAQAHSEGTSPLEPSQPFAFPPLPAPPSNSCANVDCECANIQTRKESTGELDSSIPIPIPVYECIVKQWSKDTQPDEAFRSDAASDGSLDRDKEDETITSEQVEHLLAAVQNPCTPAPIGARERRRPLDKTKRRKGIYITTASDDGGDDPPPPVNGCNRESSDASLQDMRLSAETRTSSLLGDKSDDSFTNGPPSPSDSTMPMWPKTDETLRARRARFSQQSSDEKEDEVYRSVARRKYGVTSRGDSPSEAESDTCSRDRTASPSPYSPSDTSDVEAKRQQFTRPFGRNLTPTCRSVEVGRRSFSDATVPSRKISAGAAPTSDSRPRGHTHVRATSSPSKLVGVKPGTDLLAELLRGSSEALSNASAFDNVILTLHQHNDTRTHVVVELYETEKSYVEAVEILVKKYLHPLKSPENAGLLDAFVVDEIFYQVPAILNVHQEFLEKLRRRLEQWDLQQKVGDVFLDVFTKPTVMDTYMSFISNLKKAKETIKTAASSRPAFAKFLDAMARDHKGKLSLDNLLIKPVQKFPSYKLLIQRLIKHTDQSHPDHKLLLDAQKEIHNLLELINCTERESLELEMQQQSLRELESMIEGLSNLVTSDRIFIRHETVTIPSAQGTIKDRALFLFNDTLLITSVKRRTGTIKKPIPTYQSSIASQMEGNKYKLLMRINLADLEIVKSKDENLRRIMHEVETLTEDAKTLAQISEHVAALHYPHAPLEDLVRELLCSVTRQLSERQNSDTQLCFMEISVNTSSGSENLTIIFSKTEKRSNWEELIIETKQKLSVYGHERPAPEFLSPVPIRKTRAGLQFTCAAPTLPPKGQSPDVWVCNSDGYVGQVCVLTLSPNPQVTSCNGVCNARILCVACVPPAPHTTIDLPPTSHIPGANKPGISISDPDDSCKNIRLDRLKISSSSDEEDDGSSSENQDAQSERSHESGSLRYATRTLTPNHSKSLSTPHTGQNIQVHPVMKSNSNPAVDKQAMGITSGTLSSPASRQSSEDSSTTANQPTMWLGTEDGCIHVYNCLDNIRIKKNKVKLQHNSGVHSIVYVEGKVFVALGNGDLVAYCRDIEGSWAERSTIQVGTGSTPVSSMLLSEGRLWCATHSSIKIINPHTLQIDETFQISSETKPISHMAVSHGAIWLSLHNAAQLRGYNATTRELICEINITPHVTKMLHGCDDIIRQHKAACLRVTALLAHRDTLWIGTSAGVLLTAPLHNVPSARSGLTQPHITGIPYGHTGHVRFLTIVENPVPQKPTKPTQLKAKGLSRRSANAEKLQKQAENNKNNMETLIISGGDGYEDFRSSTMTEDAGREDSTNHLLLWRV
ncbi:rho guanine nucleotide exchange factor 17 isoform X2 [Pieris rapae]|uniref:rho guanine nucleotide exchange factor 17 isoform X1 n=1 Tax=Pieris rapae TaxID=64459 RepID=UPI001E27B110|nr:rho guanine nucleotide exchange factor 17 isoform X1 [Pieris rapae]XP_045484690.1 rho guanine nucleotide exchange factor 17 isoform X2 [Pieris rapae]